MGSVNPKINQEKNLVAGIERLLKSFSIDVAPIFLLPTVSYHPS
jgi:hypothetical protein